MTTQTNTFNTVRDEIVKEIVAVKEQRLIKGEPFYKSEVYRIVDEICIKRNISGNSMVYSLGLG